MYVVYRNSVPSLTVSQIFLHPWFYEFRINTDSTFKHNSITMAPNDKKCKQYLPKYIRDELRMTVALRCFSVLREGNGKKLTELYSSMFDAYHGNESLSIASNLKLLCNASYVFKSLFDDKVQNNTSKSTSSDSGDVVSYVLKEKLARGSNQSFFAGIDITTDDLEKKNRSGPQLMSGRQLLDMAKQGTKFYRKALAYASRKYDLDTMQCKESGHTIDDVIQYVIVQMYKDTQSKNNIDANEVIDIDQNEIVEDETELEEEVIISTENDSTTVSSVTDVEDSVSTDDKETSNNDNSQVTNTEDKETTKGGEEEDVIVPSDWIFPSFFSFIAFGPFVSKENRLSLFEISDAHKNVGKSRAAKRKADQIQKDAARESDKDNVRGFNTEQQIQIKMLKIQEKKEEDRARETILVGLSIQEGALARQIERAEDRAIRLCPEDEVNRSTIHWKNVDMLMKRHIAVMQKINKINEKGIKEQRTLVDSSDQTVPSHIDTNSTPLISHSEGSLDSDITCTPSSKNAA